MDIIRGFQGYVNQLSTDQTFCLFLVVSRIYLVEPRTYFSRTTGKNVMEAAAL
jgi:hypothetical protein